MAVVVPLSRQTSLMTWPDDAGSVLMLSYQMMFDRQLFEQVYRSMLTCGDAGICEQAWVCWTVVSTFSCFCVISVRESFCLLQCLDIS